MRRLSPAVLIAVVALAAAVAGQPIADAASRLIDGKRIKKSSITSAQIKDGSLLARDFKAGELAARGGGAKGDTGPGGPAGPTGAKGERGDTGAKGDTGANGDTGAKGDTGTVDTSGFFTKSQSDARYGGTALGIAGVGFHARDSASATRVAYLGTGVIYATGGAATVTAPLNLPQGATVTGATFYMLDNNAGADIQVSVGGTDLESGSGIGSLFSGSSSGSSGSSQAVTIAPNALSPMVVDNTTTGYYAEVDIQAANANLLFYGMKVTYTRP